MDARLQSCFEKGLPPFNGVTVYLPDDVPLDRLRALSRAILGVLEVAFPMSPLWVLDDWHEHDRFISSASPATWAQIRGHVAHPEKFLYFKTGDFGVAKGIYSKNKAFYVRIVIDEDGTSPAGEGRLDVTVPPDLEAQMLQAFEESGLRALRDQAKAFFTKRAAD